VNTRHALAFVWAVPLFLFLYGCERRFAESIRNTAIAPHTAFEVCSVVNEGATDCRTLERGTRAFDEAVSALSGARASLGPGKVPIRRERILKVRSATPSTSPYSACYRLIEFAGFPDEYISEVAMDGGCSRIVTYETGYAVAKRLE
jgi:hypothetical protein